ncbi:MAG: chromosome segregation protein SMC [Bacteroidota bacterium]
MYLSKLEILGFKSFAQKVTMAFDAGISAIVGPNGCGKTNIVDAIRWVLGEQRYSALRSERMEDVIFSGTKGRKPLGMAEVSLVIENTKGVLPSEYSQVTVGRRVYRSGESEYLLNKAPCRLKDILELFMDTGMGADAYSVIELKMVETILSDKTDERRRLFEEAAGVTRYKHQRKAAYRKLENVQADLLRVNDIVAEVQKAVGSLERQARKARQYNQVQERLRAVEIDLMEREYAQLIGRVTPLEEKLSGLVRAKGGMDTDLGREEEELDRHRDRLSDADRRLANAREELSDHMESVHRVEEKNLVTAERIRALRSNVARLEREKGELQVNLQSQERRKQELRQKIEDLQRVETETQSELESRQADLSESEARLDEKKAELQSLSEKTITLVQEIAERQTTLERGRGRIENLNGRIQRAREENTAYGEEIARISGTVEELTAEDRRLRRAFAEAEMRFYEEEEKKKALKERGEELHRRELEKKSELQRVRARTDFLKGLMESREGLSEGVRYLSAVGRWRPPRKITVADAVRAEREFRTAVEAALGEYAAYIVVDTAADAAHGITLLKTDQRGKATFVSLDRLPVIHTHDAIPHYPGVIGWASEIAQHDPVYDSLFALILDRTLIVDTLETAASVARDLSGVRCVTLEGEIVTGLGIVRGGSRREDEGGMIGREQQIEELEHQLGVLHEEVNRQARERHEVLENHDKLDLRPFAETVKAIEKEMTGVEMRIAQLEFEKKRAVDIVARNSEEIEQLSRELVALEAGLEQEYPALEALRDEKGDVERQTGAKTHELELEEREWNERSARVQELGIDLVKVRGDGQNALSDVARADEAISSVDSSLEKLAEDLLMSTGEISTSEVEVGDNARVLDQYLDRRHELEEKSAVARRDADQVREEMHQIELHAKELRKSAEECLKSTHDHEMRIADLKAKADHIRARAVEEFEYTVELKSYPDDEFVDFASLRDEIQALRDKGRALGNINFAAFEEYSTEKERLDFLTGQRKDLLEAEKTLLATIEEINTTAQQKFLETFDLIRTNFIETFKSLFDPGDECDLLLEEEVDPLEGGIEIIAKPRGKRPTSIDLLSGGEKTLTATALLFAIYLVKPSPFCILDEVDAPLDDANIDRFTRILNKFSNNTQFIVVTHNKRTMESANALYGVTMEEEGVSKIVTVRFNQAAQVTSAAVATG